jgi:hypothetical protein
MYVRTYLWIEFSRRVEVVIIGSQSTAKESSICTVVQGKNATYASFNCRACSGESMPKVVQTSIPIPRTSRTISKILSNPLFLPARSLHAAPMQKRVLPLSFAFRAASSTDSSSTKREAFVGVEYRDDCEQYEPVTCSAHAQKIRESTYSPQSILQLFEWDKLAIGGTSSTENTLLMFMSVHSCTFLGS